MRTYIRAGQSFVERVILVWLKAVPPGHRRTYLAAINAPRIIVNTVSWTGLENFFLHKVRHSRAKEFKYSSSVCRRKIGSLSLNLT